MIPNRVMTEHSPAHQAVQALRFSQATGPRVFVQGKKRGPIQITAAIEGVPRTFPRKGQFRLYIQRVNHANTIGSQTRFAHIEFVPTQLLKIDRSRGGIIEKVHCGPSILSVLNAQNYEQLAKLSLYGTILAKKMIRKRIPFEDLAEAVQLAYDDVLFLRTKTDFDKNGGNAIVLDFNPITRKVKVALVDHLEE
jgi:hypothetical protein